jgi:hypothetical protein
VLWFWLSIAGAQSFCCVLCHLLPIRSFSCAALLLNFTVRPATVQVHTEKAYRSVRTAGGFLSLHGLPALTSDGRRTRSQVGTVDGALCSLHCLGVSW